MKIVNSVERRDNLLLAFLLRHTVLVLATLFISGFLIAIWNIQRFAENLVFTQAVQDARLHTQSLREARSLYSRDVVNRLKEADPNYPVGHDYSETPGGVPLPATFLINLGHQLGKNIEGMNVHLYSGYPFPWRQGGGPQDDFEQQALDFLIANPEETFSRVEEWRGRQSLRYAEADRLQRSCISCHNNHPDSPKRDWKVGDVRGVLAVTRPLDTFATQTQMAMAETFAVSAVLGLLGLAALVLVLARLRRNSAELELRVEERTAELHASNVDLQTEQQTSERLLLNVLPSPVAQRLKQGESPIADAFDEVTVLMADIVNFTPMAAVMQPDRLVALLNRIFSEFDALSEHYGLEKIKTIGDAYMAAGGLPEPQANHAIAIAAMALDMREVIKTMQVQLGSDIDIRIGICSGPVVAGVIGTRKFIFDLWGDTVNIASRMESHGIPGEIQLSASTYQLIKDHFWIEPREKIAVKGRGTMQTYFLKGREHDRPSIVANP